MKSEISDIGEILKSPIEKDQELTSEQKQEMRRLASEATVRLEKVMRDYTADATLSAQLFEETSLQLFDKTFTESELQEMVVFYRTPTGQKAAKFMTGLTGKLTRAFTEAFTQKFRTFVNSKLQEEMEQLKQKIKEAKNKKPEA